MSNIFNIQVKRQSWTAGNLSCATLLILTPVLDRPVRTIFKGIHFRIQICLPFPPRFRYLIWGVGEVVKRLHIWLFLRKKNNIYTHTLLFHLASAFLQLIHLMKDSDGLWEYIFSQGCERRREASSFYHSNEHKMLSTRSASQELVKTVLTRLNYFKLVKTFFLLQQMCQ